MYIRIVFPWGTPQMARLQLLLLCAVLLGRLCAGAEPKAVDVQLRAKWQAPPLLHEAAEYVADDSESAFWQLVGQWHSHAPLSAVEPGSSCFDAIASFTSSFLPSPTAQYPLLELSLRLREHSPRLELFRSLKRRYDVSSASETCCTARIPGIGDASSAAELRTLLARARAEPAYTAVSQSPFTAVDHVLQASHTNGSEFPALLYATPGSACFADMHPILQEEAIQGSLRYAFRLHSPSGCSDVRPCENYGQSNGNETMLLPSFGAELAMKSMEYKAIDEDEASKQFVDEASDSTKHYNESAGSAGSLQTLFGERSSEVESAIPGAGRNALEELTGQSFLRVRDLGLQAASAIAQMSDPLAALQDVSGNFPFLAPALSVRSVDEHMLDAINKNQRSVLAGSNVLLVDGEVQSVERMDAFALLQRIQQSHKARNKLKSSGLSPALISRILRLQENKSPAFRVNITSEEAIVFVNDIERDSEYSSLPRSLAALVQPRMPGTLPGVRQNVFNAVFVIDPATSDGLHNCMMAEYAIENGIPLRMGFIFVWAEVLKKASRKGMRSTGLAGTEAEPLSMLAARAFEHMRLHRGARAALRYLAEVNELRKDDDDPFEENQTDSLRAPDLSDFATAFKRVWARSASRRSASDGEKQWQALQHSLEHESTVLSNVEYIGEKGIATFPTLIFNGIVTGMSTQYSLPEQALMQMDKESMRLYELFREGRLRDGENALKALVRKEGLPKHNQRILSRMRSDDTLTVDPDLSSAFKQGNLTYLHHAGKDDVEKPVTMWVVADFGKREAEDLALEAVKFVESEFSSSSRLAFIESARVPSSLGKLLSAASRLETRQARVPIFLRSVLSNQSAYEALRTGKGWMNEVLEIADECNLNVEDLQNAIEQQGMKEARANQELLRAMKASIGDRIVLTNGRVIPLPSSERFTDADFHVLQASTLKRLATSIANLVNETLPEDLGMEEKLPRPLSDLMLRLNAFVSERSSSTEKVDLDGIAASATILNLAGEENAVSVDAIVDPVGPKAAYLGTVLEMVRESLQSHVNIRIVLNPRQRLTDVPIKSFYRFAKPGKDMAEQVPIARFDHLPPSITLTLHTTEPESWVIESSYAIHDLDNLRLEDLGSAQRMTVEFTLKSLLLTGHCFDGTAKEPPRGMQLQLRESEMTSLSGTIVMSNLGYFQLQAAPGVWELSLAPGRSRDVYQMEYISNLDRSELQGEEEEDAESEDSMEVTSEGAIDENGTSTRIALSDFSGRTLRLQVRKREGQEDDDVLHDGTSTGEAEAIETVSTGNERVHIFSVASGHLYERFLKIMILSVLRHTSSPVKFWFIENYLSPRFKDFLPHMASEYGFNFELVTYKWPSWLNKQTEKQRIIWAYKVLFLDVLFPLDLEKVIFVDADQVVRTDIKELWDMDLQGKPLAYTPFCDNNKEMEGFRFWKEGFWAHHLRGKPYHISALYVVDLKMFRRMAAGDNFRVLYEQLSKDPNSLANLDQDLPNYAYGANIVPIHSLPQEWLWCESWCGNETKSVAKTIDLCNNPLTKEPKLQAARRIVDEWPELDEEQRSLTSRLERMMYGERSASAALGDTGVQAERARGGAKEEEEKKAEIQAKEAAGVGSMDEL